MVTAVVVVRDEGADAGLEVARQIVVLQQDSVLQGVRLQTNGTDVLSG